jgi:predicted MPP superfamily phosphohydrolase
MTVNPISRRNLLELLIAPTMLGVGMLAYAHYFEPNQIEITQQSLVLPDLPAAFHNYRLVQISDLHMGTWLNRRRLQDVVNQVNAQQPDLIAITGDFLNHEIESKVQDLIVPLSQLKATDGTVVVFGNHDYWSGSWLARRMVREAGLLDVNNDVLSLERSGAVLNIAGIDDYWEGRTRFDLVMKRLPSTGPAILLAHEPDFADVSAATERFALQISGHSHGGQIVLPYWGAPVLPYMGEKYASGRYQVGKMVQYTNRGIGTSRLQLRINCRPEITTFILQSPKVV